MTAETSDAPAGDPTIAARSFDDAFAELRTAVSELEAGGLSLEETIARTERAVALQVRRHVDVVRLLGGSGVAAVARRPEEGLINGAQAAR